LVHAKSFLGKGISFKLNIMLSLTLREVQLTLITSQMDTGIRFSCSLMR